MKEIDIYNDWQIICQNERCPVYEQVFVIASKPTGKCLSCERTAKIIPPKNTQETKVNG